MGIFGRKKKKSRKSKGAKQLGEGCDCCGDAACSTLVIGTVGAIATTVITRRVRHRR